MCVNENLAEPLSVPPSSEILFEIVLPVWKKPEI